MCWYNPRYIMRFSQLVNWKQESIGRVLSGHQLGKPSDVQRIMSTHSGSVDSSILNDRRSIVLTPSFTATVSILSVTIVTRPLFFLWTTFKWKFHYISTLKKLVLLTVAIFWQGGIKYLCYRNLNTSIILLTFMTWPSVAGVAII